MGKETSIGWTEEQKIAARYAVNLEVKSGRMPNPNAIACVDCLHIHRSGERRHEYHHHNGYSPELALDVIALCTLCHYHRDHIPETECKSGHAFTPDNVHYRKNGTRECRICRREQKRRKRTAEWWRNRRARIKAARLVPIDLQVRQYPERMK